jgi:hypothetical protein
MTAEKNKTYFDEKDYSNGKYEGKLLGDKFHGTGTFYWANGD